MGSAHQQGLVMSALTRVNWFKHLEGLVRGIVKLERWRCQAARRGVKVVLPIAISAMRLKDALSVIKVSIRGPTKPLGSGFAHNAHPNVHLVLHPLSARAVKIQTYFLTQTN